MNNLLGEFGVCKGPEEEVKAIKESVRNWETQIILFMNWCFSGCYLKSGSFAKVQVLKYHCFEGDRMETVSLQFLLYRKLHHSHIETETLSLESQRLHFTDRGQSYGDPAHLCMHACMQRTPIRLGSGSQQGSSISHVTPCFCVTFHPLLQPALWRNISMSLVTHRGRDSVFVRTLR